MRNRHFLIGLVLFCLPPVLALAAAWPHGQDSLPLSGRIAPPEGYLRVSAEEGSFAQWLRTLPLLPGNPSVKLYNGQLKGYQAGHAAVIDLDVGSQDLQQCADAVMRLRAEYLFEVGQPERIAFRFSSGDRASFARWMEGYRPVVRGQKVTWQKSAGASKGHESLRRYLETVYMYAGSHSLSTELEPVVDVAQVRGGDVFIMGGFPGHAVIVVDVAEKPSTGQRVFMIAQSYMPAQQVHILRNLKNPSLSPWYPVDFGAELQTPEWTFARNTLKRFPEKGSP